MLEMIRTDADDPQFRELVALLDQDLRIRDGIEHSFYAQFNKLDKIRQVIMAFIDGEPVGCGAFKAYDKNSAEIKRMFVKPSYRGQGVARAILSELEEWAKEAGFNSCLLETGKKQPEAIALYQKAGYQLISNYGQYEHVENSICMKKDLTVL